MSFASQRRALAKRPFLAFAAGIAAAAVASLPMVAHAGDSLADAENAPVDVGRVDRDPEHAGIVGVGRRGRGVGVNGSGREEKDRRYGAVDRLHARFFSVRVQPRASSTEIVGLHGDAMKIRLAAPPVDGAANNALVDFLAAVFNVPRRDVRILAGESGRSKIVEIQGVTEHAVRAAATR